MSLGTGLTLHRIPGMFMSPVLSDGNGNDGPIYYLELKSSYQVIYQIQDIVYSSLQYRDP